ncbi:DUF416 family protein [Chitinophaga skermanii]|nr:DUF416 family protein [Chitinophaga skermanii]
MDIQKINKLDLTRGLVFCYLACKRLFPNYVYFSEHYAYGEPQKLEAAMDFIYREMLHEEPDEERLHYLDKQVKLQMPNLRSQQNIYAELAYLAATLIRYTLNMMKEKDTGYTINAMVLAFDSISVFVNHRDQNKWDLYSIEDEELTVKESNLQAGIVDYLLLRDEIDLEDVDLLSQMQSYNRKGLLDEQLELVAATA